MAHYYPVHLKLEPDILYSFLLSRCSGLWISTERKTERLVFLASCITFDTAIVIQSRQVFTFVIR